MNTRELRIGNLVSHKNDNGEFILRVEEVLLNGVAVRYDGFWHLRSESIEPILLTEELLLNIGFKKEVILDNDEIDHYFVLYDDETSEEIYLTYFDGKFWFALEYDSWVVKTIPVNGIHSVQNRWYSLVGKELDFINNTWCEWPDAQHLVDKFKKK